MKAIDFACRLLMRVEQDSMPSGCRLVLLMVAAGVDNAQDIAAMTGLRPSSCTNLLRKLARERYLRGWGALRTFTCWPRPARSTCATS